MHEDEGIEGAAASGDDPTTPKEGARTTEHLIGLAQITFDGLFAPANLDEAVAASWKPGASKDLYNRRWIITKILERPQGGFYGRIGFVKEGEVSTLKFDPDRGDFVEGAAPSGVTVPFFISPDGRVSYQLIANVVREATFIRAFTELMHEGNDGVFQWTVIPLSVERSYDDWIRSVAKVTKFDFRLDRPNPHYDDDYLIEKLVEDTRAVSIRLAGMAPADGQIDTESDPFRQALDHVERKYGRATITGLDDNDSETVWAKMKGAAARTLARVKTRGTGPQASVDELVGAVSNLPAGSQAVTISDSEDDLAG